MNKREQRGTDQQPQKPEQKRPVQSSPQIVVQKTEQPPETPKSIEEHRGPSGRKIERHRQCPLCWERCKGYGTAYGGTPNGKTYYRCNQTLTEQPPCGHTWSAVITLHSVTIEHRTVNLDGMR